MTHPQKDYEFVLMTPVYVIMTSQYAIMTLLYYITV